MTQFHSAPATAGSEHRVKPTALALHVASVASWGRPWRRRALSLPSPRILTFQGIKLPLQPLRSWLHLLSRAGMLGVRPPEAASVLRRPEEDDEDTPARIEDLGFELATEMILDFASFARQSRLNSADEEARAETAENGEALVMAASAGIDDLHAIGMAESVASESVDQDFLGADMPAPQESVEPAPASRARDAEPNPALDGRVPLAESQEFVAPKVVQAAAEPSDLPAVAAAVVEIVEPNPALEAQAPVTAEAQELAAPKVVQAAAEPSNSPAVAAAALQIVEPTPALEAQAPVMAEAQEPVAPKVAQEAMEHSEPPAVTSPESVAPVELPVPVEMATAPEQPEEEAVEPQLEVHHDDMLEMEVPVVTTAIEP